MDSKLKEQNANSLLHSSIIKGNKSTFLEALKLGCNLKSLSKYGDPALVSAAGVDPYTAHDRKSGKDRMLVLMDLILDQEGADPNLRGAGGETALHRAVAVRSQSRMKLLLERGCDVDIRDSRGQTALFMAMGFVEGLELLLRYQPLLDVYDVDGNTPLLHVMMSESPNSVQTMKMLTDAGCNVNCVSTRDQKTALMSTLRSDGQIPRSDQRVEKSIMLIARGIDIDAQDSRGKTALHYAVESQCVSLIKTLLKNKVSVEIRDKTDKTVEEIAKHSSNAEVIRLIERAVDKSSRLLPYEDTLVHLETVFDSVDTDGELTNEQKFQIKSQIEALEKSLQRIITQGRGTDMMPIEHKRTLNNKHNELCEEMMPHFLLSPLEKKGVLLADDVTAITGEKSRTLMCVKLLEIIQFRGSNAFPCLIKALDETNQAHVSKLLIS